MTASEVVVTKKGQITIPVKLRRKFGIEESSKVQVIEEQGKIVIKKRPSIFDLAGSGVGKGTVDELKILLDDMREQDA
jgi:AbrB family looped-hinge helix DNA binding protein